MLYNNLRREVNMAKDERVNISLTISAPVIEAVRAKAEEENRTLSNMVETILKKAVNEE